MFVGPLLYGHISSPQPSLLVRSLEGIYTGVWWFLLHLIFSLPLSLSGHPISSSCPPLLSPPWTTALPFLSPSPIPLSQLPAELAAIQDSADGSVIRSASLRSLFSSPLLFLFFFSLFNQITEDNFSPFGFEFFKQFDAWFLSRMVLIEKDIVVQYIGAFMLITTFTKSNCSDHYMVTSHSVKKDWIMYL